MEEFADYPVLGRLGSGQTGTVYLCHDPRLDRKVAIKELSPALVSDPTFIERFRGEAQIMARLDHPNCVRVYNLHEEPGRAYLVSEYIDGSSLRKVIEASGRLTAEQALGVVKGALSGLAYGHAIGLIHLDVKPENVLADREGVSKLADFGQAVFVAGPGAAGGLPSGTPAYMSPEQVNGAPLDRRTDIYSMGAMLFEFLTGRVPFAAKNPLATMRQHVSKPVPDARKVNPELSAGVAAMLSRAMAKDPAERQETVEQFLGELETAAVEAYGEDWESRSSIKRKVLAALALLGVISAGEAVETGAGTVQAGAASEGQAVDVATSTVEGDVGAAGGAGDGGGAGGAGAAGDGSGGGRRRRWQVGLAIIVAMLLVAGAGGFAYSQDLFGMRHAAGARLPGGPIVATTSPTPSPSEEPSPTPSPSPSPSSSAESRTPTPRGPVVLPGPITVSNLDVDFNYCGPTIPTGCTGYLRGADYGSADHPFPNSSSALDCRSGTKFSLAERYDWADPGPGGPPIDITIQWNAVHADGSPLVPPPRVDQTATPGNTGFQDVYAATPIDTGNSSTGYTLLHANYTLSWTDPDRTSRSATSPNLWWSCSGGGGV